MSCRVENLLLLRSMTNAEVKLELIDKGYILRTKLTAKQDGAIRKHIDKIRKSGFIVYKNRVAWYTPQQKNAFEVHPQALNYYGQGIVGNLNTIEVEARAVGIQKYITKHQLQPTPWQRFKRWIGVG